VGVEEDEGGADPAAPAACTLIGDASFFIVGGTVEDEGVDVEYSGSGLGLLCGDDARSQSYSLSRRSDFRLNTASCFMPSVCDIQHGYH
jgi:hypothetical protein